jgi:glycerate kinase
MADGGEGTIKAVLAARDSALCWAAVCGPLGSRVDARWCWLPDSHTAIIEMAEASGLQLIPLDQRDACISSTYGTGELIRAALDAGAQRVILAVGGSATNDGGAGAMQALGVKLLTGTAFAARRSGAETTGEDRSVGHRSASGRRALRNRCGCGQSTVRRSRCLGDFRSAKGASPEQVEQLDRALGHFADHCAKSWARCA